MSTPISPAPVRGGARDDLPAYVANGVLGLRVREMPLAGGPHAYQWLHRGAS